MQISLSVEFVEWLLSNYSTHSKVVVARFLVWLLSLLSNFDHFCVWLNIQQQNHPKNKKYRLGTQQTQQMAKTFTGQRFEAVE